MGSWFPRNDRAGERELYCASMLTLLKPWSDLAHLKQDTQHFEQAFVEFVGTALKKTLDIIENIQYYYECYDGAKRRQEMQAAEAEMPRDVDYEEEASPDDLTTDSLNFCPEMVAVTDEDIELAYETRGLMREKLHADVAVNTAGDYGVFVGAGSETVFLPTAERALPEDLTLFSAWDEQLKAVCRAQALQRKVDQRCSRALRGLHLARSAFPCWWIRAHKLRESGLRP